jgi:NAD-dependent histone deacetylase SIR2
VPLCPRCPAERTPIEEVCAPPAKKRKLNAKPWDDGSDDEDDNGTAPSEWLGKPVLKPRITFFGERWNSPAAIVAHFPAGEKLDDTFGEQLLLDRGDVDLLLVIGTSLKVAPVSDVLGHIPHSVPQILINRDPVTHAAFDVMLLGDADAVVRWLCKQLGDGWSVDAPDDPRRVHASHVYLFEGANEGHRWVRAMQQSTST